MTDPPEGPRSRRPSLRPTFRAAPDPESEPPSSAHFARDDFLYHLSYGSELLKDNEVERAKEELERALRLQPEDASGQGLLGVVYFRLGLYPRAIDIYRRLIVSCPEEITPRVNLGLCYLKTGQLALARETLEQVIERDESHRRAWSYLGLVHQFQGDLAKARIAFERADQPAMVRRLDELEAAASDGDDDSTPPERRDEMRAAVADAEGEMERVATPFLSDEEAATTTFKPGRWRALEPGQEKIPASTPSLLGLPPEVPNRDDVSWKPALTEEFPPCETDDRRIAAAPLGSWLAEHGLFPGQPGTTLLGARNLLVEFEQPFAVRARAVRLIAPARASTEQRLLRYRDDPTHGIPLGGAARPIVGFIGPGRLWAEVESGAITLVALRDESITLRESALVGFDLGLHYQIHRLLLGQGEGIEMLSLEGRGVVAFHTAEPPVAQRVSDQDAILLADRLVGWCGPLVPRPLDFAESPGKQRAFLLFQGEGELLLEKSPAANQAGT